MSPQRIVSRAAGKPGERMAPDSIRIFEVEPDLARFLSDEDRTEAERLLVPVLTVERGPLDVAHALGEAFGAVVLEGMVLQRLQLGSHLTMKVFGPGDLLARGSDSGSMLIGDLTFSALEGTRLALLGAEFLLATRRWPALVAGLHLRAGEQAERVAVQLAICQLPRVEERLLSLFWWLAESWGRVTSTGTMLPMAITHDVLGALVGARRPTVTLAVGDLVQRGAIARQDRGWLLLEPPPGPARRAAEIDDPELVPSGQDAWQTDEPWSVDVQETRRALLDTVSRLREEHDRRAVEVEARLGDLRRTREALTARRERAAPTPRRAPSS